MFLILIHVYHICNVGAAFAVPKYFRTDESYIIFIILSLHLQSQNILDTDESYIIFIIFVAAFAEPKCSRY